MANKDPAVLLYTSDFLSGVSLMTMKERGQYITLLCLQRERGHMTDGDVKKAVGKLSSELNCKFVKDADGKLYNVRMDVEIKKRNDHCKKQKENIEKRWNQKKDNTGTPFGNTVVLPLGNGSGNRNTYVETYVKDEGTLDARDPPTPQQAVGGVAAVLADYLNRVNPTASPHSLEELRGYAEELGETVCKRAFDIALDSKVTTWPYIKGILKDKQAKGIRCLADWTADEESHQDSRKRGGKRDNAPAADPEAEMKRFVQQLRKKERDGGAE